MNADKTIENTPDDPWRVIRETLAREPVKDVPNQTYIQGCEPIKSKQQKRREAESKQARLFG